MDEREKNIVESFVPNKYDVFKILIFCVILSLAFMVGYYVKEVRTCKLWYNDQMKYFPAEDEPFIYNDWLEEQKNKTMGGYDE